jgi:hypothetical protein
MQYYDDNFGVFEVPENLDMNQVNGVIYSKQHGMLYIKVTWELSIFIGKTLMLNTLEIFVGDSFKHISKVIFHLEIEFGWGGEIRVNC